MEEFKCLSFEKLFTYLDSTPSSRCINEGQAVVNANHIIICGTIAKTEVNITIFALCLQSSALAENPHEVKGMLSINLQSIDVIKFTCTCKAGMSGRCKHIAAVLILCTRDNILTLPELSSTDLKCYWKKSAANNKYVPIPLEENNCFNKKVETKKMLSKDKCIGIAAQFAALLPDSALAKHRKGCNTMLNAVTEISNDNVDISILDAIVNICKRKNIVDSFSSSFVSNCNQYDNLSNVDVMNILQQTMHNQARWALERQFRITGSRCYSLFTYSGQDWQNKSVKYFWPKSFKSKYTEYGKQYESVARNTYAKK